MAQMANLNIEIPFPTVMVHFVDEKINFIDTLNLPSVPLPGDHVELHVNRSTEMMRVVRRNFVQARDSSFTWLVNCVVEPAERGRQGHG